MDKLKLAEMKVDEIYFCWGTRKIAIIILDSLNRRAILSVISKLCQVHTSNLLVIYQEVQQQVVSNILYAFNTFSLVSDTQNQ